MLVQPCDDIPSLEETCISLGVLCTPVVLIRPNHQDCRARRHTVLIIRATFMLLFYGYWEDVLYKTFHVRIQAPFPPISLSLIQTLTLTWTHTYGCHLHFKFRTLNSHNGMYLLMIRYFSLNFWIVTIALSFRISVLLCYSLIENDTVGSHHSFALNPHSSHMYILPLWSGCLASGSRLWGALGSLPPPVV